MPITTDSIKQARNQGYDESQIVDHLAKVDPRFKTAFDAGYTLPDIERHLGHQETQARLSQPVPDLSKDTGRDIVRAASPVIQAGADTIRPAAPTAEALGATPVAKNLRQATSEYEGTATKAGTSAQLPEIPRKLGSAVQMISMNAPAAIMQIGINAFDSEIQKSGSKT